jgi:hypothetical protein
MSNPRSLPETDREIEDLNRKLLEIIYNLGEKYLLEAEFALMKLRSASEDIHRIRISHTFNKSIK